MFDDKPIDQKADGTVPKNLPMGEPEDMFAKADGGVPAAPQSPSALDAGALKPAATAPRPAPMPVAPSIAPRPVAGTASQAPKPAVAPLPPAPAHKAVSSPGMQQEPHAARSILVVIVIVIALGLLIGGSLWLYFSFIQGDESITQPVIVPTSEQIDGDTVVEPIEDDQIEEEIVEEPEDDINNILFGDVPEQDMDNDGLSDIKEQDFSTDPDNWDTDGDLLSDGDEILIWKSDPLNPDTDNDGFDDGAEVKSGYSPTGPEKIFQPPTTTVTTTDTSSFAL